MEELRKPYKAIMENLDKICPKCNKPYREHLGTGLEWLCPINKRSEDK